MHIFKKKDVYRKNENVIACKLEKALLPGNLSFIVVWLGFYGISTIVGYLMQILFIHIFKKYDC